MDPEKLRKNVKIRDFLQCAHLCGQWYTFVQRHAKDQDKSHFPAEYFDSQISRFYELYQILFVFRKNKLLEALHRLFETSETFHVAYAIVQ